MFTGRPGDVPMRGEARPGLTLWPGPSVTRVYGLLRERRRARS
jgi:hypothetical protein